MGRRSQGSTIFCPVEAVKYEVIQAPSKQKGAHARQRADQPKKAGMRGSARGCPVDQEFLAVAHSMDPPPGRGSSANGADHEGRRVAFYGQIFNSARCPLEHRAFGHAAATPQDSFMRPWKHQWPLTRPTLCTSFSSLRITHSRHASQQRPDWSSTSPTNPLFRPSW